MAAAFIDGQPAALADAIEEAVRLLREARLPVIAGLGADVAAARAAIGLAEMLGCPFDHMASDAVFAALSVMRDSGWMVVSPDEGRRLADVVLLAGVWEKSDWPGAVRCLPRPSSSLKLVVLGSRALGRHLASLGYRPETLDSSRQDFPAMLAALRATASGRPAAGPRSRKLEAAATVLKGARFGVALWPPASLDRLATEMLAGLVRDLNAGTRFSSAPLPVASNGWGVAQASGWLTGFPMRTGFARGYPEHDPWRFDATRLVDEGEADAALWVSCLATDPPAWRKQVDLVAIARAGARFHQAPRVHIEVGIPGVDHDAVGVSPDTGSLAYFPASAASDRLPAARALGMMAERVSESLS